MICPCKGCDARHALCHSECEKYREWREASLIRKRGRRDGEAAKDFLIKSVIKTQQRDRRKNKWR